MIQDNEYNQTIFSEEEPFFEEKPKKKGLTKKRKIGMALIGMSVCGVLFLGLLVRMFSSRQQVVNIQPSPTPIQTNSEQRSAMDQLFFELDADIKNSDPAENVFPFPPVEEDIRVSAQ